MCYVFPPSPLRPYLTWTILSNSQEIRRGGGRVAVISTAPLAPCMGYVWEVEENDDAADKKGDGTKKRKRKREKRFLRIGWRGP